MKKLFKCTTILAIVMNVTIAFGQDPIEIDDRAGLEAIANGLGGNYVLTDDIDLSDGDWTAIGTGSSPFTGVLDGAGHKITGLRFNLPGENQIGLFRETSNATIKRIGFEQANIVGNANTGLIVGWAKNTIIEEVYVANSYIEGRDHTGAIAGAIENGSIVRNCWSNARVYSREHQGGGLVGIFGGGEATISKCYFSGTVQCPDRPTGIVALNDADNSGNGKKVEYCLTLSPYIIGGSRLRIGGEGSGNRVVTFTHNYALHGTLLGGTLTMFNGDAVTGSDTNYGAGKKHGADILNGDDNAKAAGQSDFYESVLGWDFTDTWKFFDDGYPQLKWQQAPAVVSFLTLTASKTLQTDNVLSLKSDEPIDLAASLVLNNNVVVTYSLSSDDKAEIDGSSLSVKSGITITAPEEITVSVVPTSEDFTCSQVLRVLLLPTEPIQLYTAEDLALLNVAPTLHFELATDIDLSGETFTPIDNFSGTLDGKGHVISGLTCNSDATSYMGLIRHLSGTVKNLGLENANIVGSADVGGIAGETTSGARIEECYVINSYIEGRDHVGAIVGGMKKGGTVINSYANARVHSREHQAGGITGVIQRDDLIENCYYAGVVSNAGNRAVGIAGYQDDSGAPADHYPTIKNSVCLSPYLLTSDWSSNAVRIVHPAGTRPLTLINNYGLTTTLRSKIDFSEGNVVPESDQWALANQPHGAQVTPNNLDENFYKTTLSWDFNDIWEFREGAYPVLKWQSETVASEPALKYTYGYANTVELQKDNAAGIDLSRYMLSGYGFAAEFVANETDKITVDGNILKVNATFNPMAAVATIVRFTSPVSGFTMADELTVNIIPAVSFSGLSVTEGVLSPAFDPMVLEYTLSVDGSVDAVTIAVETGDGISVKSGTGSRPVNYGRNTLSVVATNGEYDKTYTIVVEKGLFSVSDLQGNGKRRMNIHSRNGGASNAESPYKLLIGKDAINGQQNNKWCPTGDGGAGSQVWVIFSFADTYEVGAVEWRDKLWLESNENDQVDVWKVELSNDLETWNVVVDATGQGSKRVKYETFTPQDARYLRFTVTKRANAAWIYGFDIYGKYVAPYEPVDVVSRGKTILSYTGGYWEGNGRETPANILDGNFDSDPWASTGDGLSVEIDLEDAYDVGGFRLTNKQEISDYITNYKVSVRQDLTDEWEEVSETAMPLENDGIKLGDAVTGERILPTAVTARYVKLEISKNRSNGWVRIREFEVLKLNPAVIEPGVTVDASKYVGYEGNIVFKSNDAGTGQITSSSPVTLQATGTVKLVKTFKTDRWYPIGFPFAIDNSNITIKYGTESVVPGVIYDGDKGKDEFSDDGTKGNFFVKEYNAENNYFVFTDAIAANTGYIVEFPAGEFESSTEVEVTFVSSESPTLTIGATGADIPGENTSLSLVVNSNVSNITGIGNAMDYYQYDYDPSNPLFTRLSQASLANALKPFEAIVAVKTGTDESAFRSAIGDGSGGFTALEALPGLEELQEVLYYTLQGVRIYSPQVNGVYIVKKIYASGKTDISKIIYKNKE